MKRFKAIAGILSIFLLGITAGILGTHLVFKHRFESFQEKGFPPIRPMLMKRISDQLDLSDAQCEKVEKILTTLSVELEEIHGKSYPKIVEVFDNSFGQIEKHLTEAQKEKFDIFRKRLPSHLSPDKRSHERRKRYLDHSKKLKKDEDHRFNQRHFEGLGPM